MGSLGWILATKLKWILGLILSVRKKLFTFQSLFYDRRLGKSKLKLPVGEVFSKKGKDNVIFIGPRRNITYYHYTNRDTSGDDCAMFQHQHDDNNDKLMMYAIINSDQYNIVSCGYDCHLWIRTKYRTKK